MGFALHAYSAALLLLCCCASSDAPAAPSSGSGTNTPDASTDTDAGDASTTPDTSTTATNAKVVWIGAHPDDELYAAPYLAKACVEDATASCTFVVFTRGEGGKCKLAAGCAPDLATMRDKELVASAAHYNATLIAWDLGDGNANTPSGVAESWKKKKPSLLEDVAKILEGATTILSFDPRHGDSCHPDHRAAGSIAILARRSLSTAPFVTMVASKGVTAPAVPTDAAVTAFDASVLLARPNKTAWSFLIDTLTTHASQFTAEEVAALRDVPMASQKTFLVSEKDAVENDPKYASVCP